MLMSVASTMLRLASSVRRAPDADGGISVLHLTGKTGNAAFSFYCVALIMPLLHSISGSLKVCPLA